MDKNIWLVEHPTYRYVEDVRELARKAGLIVLDATQASDAERELAAASPPKLTLRDEFAKAKKPSKEATNGDR